MRDKDAQLIFESYRKRVLLNEVAKALAVPAVEGLGLFMSWMAGTAVGAVIIDQAAQMLAKIPEFKRRQIEAKISEVNRVISLNPEEIRSHYEVINAIKQNGNATLSQIAEKFKQPIDIFRSAQDNMDITVDTYYAVLTTSIEAHRELLNAQDSIDREIDRVVSQSDLADVRKEEIKAQIAKDKLKHKERLAELKNERIKLEIEKNRSGGGPGGNGKDPKGKWGLVAGVTGGINILGAILRVLSKNFQALKGMFWATVILVPGFGIFIIKTLFGSGKEYGKAAEEFAKEFKQEVKGETDKTPPSPATGKYPVGKRVKPDQQTPDKKTEPAPAKSKSKYALENLD